MIITLLFFITVLFYFKNKYDAYVKEKKYERFLSLFVDYAFGEDVEFCLKKGEAIFIPKGKWHDTFTTNENSLHCAIGFYPEKMSDLINKRYKNLLYENIYKFGKIK